MTIPAVRQATPPDAGQGVWLSRGSYSAEHELAWSSLSFSAATAQSAQAQATLRPPPASTYRRREMAGVDAGPREIL
jgi:hypothetical protein